MMIVSTYEWWENWDDCLDFGAFLTAERIIVRAKDLMDYFVNPWKWTEDFLVWKENE